MRAVFSPDNEKILTISPVGPQLWEAETGKKVRDFSDPDAGWGDGAAFAPDGQRVLTSGGFDKRLHTWEVATGRRLRTLANHTEAVEGVAFAPNGWRGLSASEDHTVRLWDVNIGRELHRFTDHKEAVRRVAASPDGRLALSGGGDDPKTGGKDFALRLWDFEKRKLVSRLDGHKTVIRDLSFSADGKRALSGSWEEVIVWDIGQGKELCRVPAKGAASIAPNGLFVLFADKDYSLVLWRLPP